MIVVKLMAGLGNQMFQYATARRLAHFRNTGLKLDTTSYGNMADVDTPRSFELDDYKITAAIADKKDLGRMLPMDFQATPTYRFKRRLGFDTRLRPLGEPSKAFYDGILRARDNTYLVGWWQNEKYFSDIREILLSEFRPKKLSSYSTDILKQIKAGNSVSIHVRRGDYVTNKHANKEHGLTPIQYYKAAMGHIDKIVGKSRYFVFSDDLKWCKTNLPTGENAVFVEAVGRKSCEDVYLMQHAKHNIIANSSFSWWGGWLNNNSDKIVVAPKIWFQNRESNEETEVVPESWVRL